MYRKDWGYFHHNKDNDYTLYHTEREIKTELKGIEELLDKAVDLSPRNNGNAWGIVNLMKISQFLQNPVRKLIGLHKKRSESAPVYELDFYLEQLADINSKLETYNHKKATKIVDIKQAVEAIFVEDTIRKTGTFYN